MKNFRITYIFSVISSISTIGKTIKNAKNKKNVLEQTIGDFQHKPAKWVLRSYILMI
jgi:hypothetical protein